MTAKQALNSALIELNKKKAPSLLLEDYNYFINKAVNQYSNRMYNAYEVNQQKTDDLRSLRGPATLIPTLIGNSSGYGETTLFEKVYEVTLPDDYQHMLGCVAEYQLQKDYQCLKKDAFIHVGVLRQTSDMFPQILNNHYFKPSYKKPYYYITNVTTHNEYPTIDDRVDVENNKYTIQLTNALITTLSTITITLPIGSTMVTCTAAMTTSALQTALLQIPALAVSGVLTVSGNTILIKESAVSNIAISGPGLLLFKDISSIRIAENRYGNKSKVRMEIRCGQDDSTFKLNKVFIDYLKAPQFIQITQDQIDEAEDTTQILEFPDYVCQEIVNELVKLLMENASDPRIQSHIPINQSIAVPGQDQGSKR